MDYVTTLKEAIEELEKQLDVLQTNDENQLELTFDDE